MKELAKKSIGNAIGFIIVIILGLVMLFLKQANSRLPFYGVVIVIIGAIFLIHYISIPKVMISLNDKNQILIHNNNTLLNISDITDVSYRQDTGRGIKYKFGTIMIRSTKGDFKFRYVRDCERAAKDILEIINNNKTR